MADTEHNIDLIARLKDGDTTAIVELYDLYYDRIYSFVYNHLDRNHSYAEDVVQETWLTVIKSTKKFKGQSQPYTWIYGIAINKIREFQRRHSKETSKQYTSSDPSLALELERIIDSKPLPDELLEKRETKEKVLEALGSLPSHYQDVLILKYVENMSVKEIGQSTGKSVKSVEGLLSRARSELRDKLTNTNE